MEVQFSSRKLQKNLCSELKLRRKYPKDADKIKRRLEEMRSADNLDDLLTLPQFHQGKYHPLTEDRKGGWAGHLEHPARIIFEPKYSSDKVKEEDQIDFKSVTVIRVLEICPDYPKRRKQR